MNILHLIDTTGPGGAETVFTELAEYTAKSGKGQTLAVVRGDGWVKRRLESRGVPTQIMECKGSFNLAFLMRLCLLIRRRQIDIIHSHLLGSNVYASMAGLLTGAKVLSTFHGAVDIGERERFWAMKSALVRRGSTVVAVSEELRQLLAERMHLDRAAINFVPNAIDCRRFAEARADGLRADWASNSSVPVVGALGNIRPAKAYAIAIRAVAQLREAGRPVLLVIAGHQKEPLMAELVALCDELGISDQIKFLGFVESPEKFLASIDVFVLSSSSEGHPLALTQAMAAGLPIVSTRSGVERIINEGMAWLVPKNDSAALAQAIDTAVRSTSEALARGKAAQNEALAKYDFGAMFGRYDAMYKSLADSD